MGEGSSNTIVAALDGRLERTKKWHGTVGLFGTDPPTHMPNSLLVCEGPAGDGNKRKEHVFCRKSPSVATRLRAYRFFLQTIAFSLRQFHVASHA